jgi:sulfate adenylyltransferase
MIRAHGGRLINRMAGESDIETLEAEAATLPTLVLNHREVSDVALIANGAMSPLEGFMTQDEYRSVIDRCRLPLGLPWTIPVTLSVKDEEIARGRPPFRAGLQNTVGETIGIMDVEDIFEFDKKTEAEAVLLTHDSAHPGVRYLDELGRFYAGGQITLFGQILDDPRFANYTLDPRECRILFKAKGWERVVAFETRHPIHRGHEYLQKCALEGVDGLLTHPIVSDPQPGDIPAEVRVQCYLAMMNNYFPPDRVTLSLLPAAMRYAGPREAIFHAILEKNYGCTHFIVGRDHAGIGSYYGRYDAHRIFDEYEPGELDIIPVMFDEAFYCQRCQGMASQKTCAHDEIDRVFLSGTKVRELLEAGDKLPVELTRREVAEILERHYASPKARR